MVLSCDATACSVSSAAPMPKLRAAMNTVATRRSRSDADAHSNGARATTADGAFAGGRGGSGHDIQIRAMQAATAAATKSAEKKDRGIQGSSLLRRFVVSK